MLLMTRIASVLFDRACCGRAIPDAPLDSPRVQYKLKRTAYRLFKHASAAGDAEANFRLGCCHLLGLSFMKTDMNAACEYFLACRDVRHIYGEALLAVMDRLPEAISEEGYSRKILTKKPDLLRRLQKAVKKDTQPGSYGPLILFALKLALGLSFDKDSEDEMKEEYDRIYQVFEDGLPKSCQERAVELANEGVSQMSTYLVEAECAMGDGQSDFWRKRTSTVNAKAGKSEISGQDMPSPLGKILRAMRKALAS